MPDMPEHQMAPRMPELPATGTEKGTDQAPRTPERGVERVAERSAERSGQDMTPALAAVLPSDRTTAAPAAKPESLQRVESVLEEGLIDFYVQLPPQKQAEFKRVGEETAKKIDQLMHGAKATAKKIFALIRSWLKLIPGVNTYFLEQEAKIKTDTIMRGE